MLATRVSPGDRIRVNVLLSGGFNFQRTFPECDPFNFTPHVLQPTLMINGDNDNVFPLEGSQRPMFRTLGVAERDRRHVVVLAGHSPSNELIMKDILEWLDK